MPDLVLDIFIKPRFHIQFFIIVFFLFRSLFPFFIIRHSLSFVEWGERYFGARVDWPSRWDLVARP